MYSVLAPHVDYSNVKVDGTVTVKYKFLDKKELINEYRDFVVDLVFDKLNK